MLLWALLLTATGFVGTYGFQNLKIPSMLPVAEARIKITCKVLRVRSYSNWSSPIRLQSFAKSKVLMPFHTLNTKFPFLPCVFAMRRAELL